MTSRTQPLLAGILGPKKRQLVTVFGLSLATLALVKDTLLDIHQVHGPSMSPTLSPQVHTTGAKDQIVTLKRNFRSTPAHRDFGVSFEVSRPARATLNRGDVVTFWSPHSPEGLGVKRVVGMPGDTIVRNEKRVARQRERGGIVSRKMGMEVPPLVVKVPMGHVWVEGDNWRNSVDSNDYGTIPISLVTARVVGVVWPPSRMGKVPPLEVKDAAVATAIPARRVETSEMDALL